jgi:hypothetical protein
LTTNSLKESSEPLQSVKDVNQSTHPNHLPISGKRKIEKADRIHASEKSLNACLSKTLTTVYP